MTLNKRLPVVHSEYPFLKSCMAVKQMGIDVRDIRKLLVSNLMPCMEKRAVQTRDKACQVKRLHTKDAACQGKVIKRREVGCQFKGFRRKDVACQSEQMLGRRNIGCQYKANKQVGDSLGNSSSDVAHVTEDLSTQQERKRKESDVELGDCARARPKITKQIGGVFISSVVESAHVTLTESATQQKKRSNTSSIRENSNKEIKKEPYIENEFPEEANKDIGSYRSRSNNEDRVLSSFSPKEQQENVNGNTDLIAIMPSPDNYIKGRSQAEATLQPFESDGRASPEIPRQDSVKLHRATSMNSPLKRKSVRLELKRLDRSALPLTTSGHLTNMDKINTGTLSSKERKSSSITNIQKVGAATSEFSLTSHKKKKCRLRGQTTEPFKLSVVDDKKYVERSSAIKMDTSVLIAPKLQQTSFFRQ